MPVDTKEIIEKYKRLHVDELVELAAFPGELREDALPFLQQELIQRGRTTEAQAIADWIANGGASQINANKEAQQHYADTAEWIREAKNRANDNEPLEDIVKEAAERGEETLTELKKQGWYQDAYIDYIKGLKKEGLLDEEIEKKLGISYSLADAAKYRRRLQRNGIIVLIAGIVSTIKGTLGYEETKKYGGDDLSQMINIISLILGLIMIVLAIALFIKSKK